MTIAYVNWPPSESTPYTDESGMKRARLRILFLTVIREHVVRPLLGLPLPGTFFNNSTQALQGSLSLAVRIAVARYEPGVVIPNGVEGVAILQEVIKGVIRHKLVVNYRDVDEPGVIPDPISVRLRSG